MFRIVAEPIVDSLLDVEVAAGGVVTFEGRVRATNDGNRVLALEYEAYGQLAEKEGAKILAEAMERFSLVDSACAHRVGLLQLGDVAIRVEVASGHRREAFEACEFIVDETKRRVPIWKKEHYEGGVTDWLHADGRKAITESALYDRQIRVPEIGAEGQERLRNARVLVVGAGGLGSPALTYLAAAGVGHLTIVEPDSVDASNLHRQSLYGWPDVGYAKGRLAAERLRKSNPFVTVSVVPKRLTVGNAAELVAGHELVVDGTDNFTTKFVLNDVCVAAGIPLILASVHRWEGQIMVVAPGGPCYRCMWPEPPMDGCVGTCADDGVLGVVPGVLGTLQASETIKALLGMEGNPGEMALVDLRDLRIERVRVPKNPGCPACSGGLAEPKKESGMEVFVGEPLDGFLVVDIRERHEVEEEPLPLESVFWMPMSAFNLSAPEFREAKKILLVCHAGVRSAYLAEQLRRQGDDRYFTLVGGLLAM